MAIVVSAAWDGSVIGWVKKRIARPPSSQSPTESVIPQKPHSSTVGPLKTKLWRTSVNCGLSDAPRRKGRMSRLRRLHSGGVDQPRAAREHGSEEDGPALSKRDQSTITSLYRACSTPLKPDLSRPCAFPPPSFPNAGSPFGRKNHICCVVSEEEQGNDSPLREWFGGPRNDLVGST